MSFGKPTKTSTGAPLVEINGYEKLREPYRRDDYPMIPSEQLSHFYQQIIHSIEHLEHSMDKRIWRIEMFILAALAFFASSMIGIILHALKLVG